MTGPVDPTMGEQMGWPDQPAAHDLADLVVAAVMSVPGVSGMHPGAFGEVATYLPGRRVTGVRLAEDSTEVHVRILMGADVLATAAAVRAVVEPLVSTKIDVYVEDVDAHPGLAPIALPD